MGWEGEVKSTGSSSAITLTLDNSVQSAMAAFRDRFRETLGSEPIVNVLGDGLFNIATYGAGEYQIVGKFGIKELPGCCGVVVFYHASVTPKFLKKGLGNLFLQLREKAAMLAGYSRAQATVLKSNRDEIKILEGNKWERMFDFNNRRTRNVVVAFLKVL